MYLLDMDVNGHFILLTILMCGFTWAQECTLEKRDECMFQCMDKGMVALEGTECMGCQCREICAKTTCNAGEKCIPLEVHCFRAPCPSVPQCVEDQECTLEKSDGCMFQCMDKGMVALEGTECMGCQCREICAKTTCNAGEKCIPQVVNCIRAPCPPMPQCIEDQECTLKERDACMFQCMDNGMVALEGTECMGCQCRDVCAKTTCNAGEKCIPLEVNCFRAPCPPMPQCIEDQECILAKRDACMFQCMDKGMVALEGTECMGCQCKEICAETKCNAGEKCIPLEVNCPRAPCPSMPQCVEDQECSKGDYYGRGCNMPCPSGCSNDDCDAKGGTCYDCQEGWQGVFCDDDCAQGCLASDEDECDLSYSATECDQYNLTKCYDCSDCKGVDCIIVTAGAEVPGASVMGVLVVAALLEFLILQTI